MSEVTHTAGRHTSGKRLRRVGLSILALSVFGGISAAGTWAAFSDTTSNDGNAFVVGTVDIDDDDAGTALYAATTNAKPGDSDEGCLNLSFSGTLASSVKLYGSNNLNANPLDDQLTLTITKGSGAAGGSTTDCTGFTPAGTGSAVFTGSLASFMTTHNTYAGGLAVNDQGNNAVWTSGDAVSYKFNVTLTDDGDVSDANHGTPVNGDSGVPFSTGAHSFTWEARNN